jgi:hypothetical protein
VLKAVPSTSAGRRLPLSRMSTGLTRAQVASPRKGRTDRQDLVVPGVGDRNGVVPSGLGPHDVHRDQPVADDAA